jgi:DNA-binding NtrC family response regulator
MVGELAEAGTGDALSRDPLAISPEVKGSIRILIVEDDRTLREGLTITLRAEGYNISVLGSGEEAVESLRRSRYEIVITDLHLPRINGIDVVRAALQSQPETIVVVITGNPNVTSSIEALRAGAWDYLPKPFSATHLQILLGRASHAVLQTRENRELRAQLMRKGGNGTGVTLLGTTPAFRDALGLARKVAGTDASVFLMGESGTGKELFAQFVHQNSRRSTKPFVAINCAALPETLLESEMFGHRKGAFTGADREKPGLLEAAHGGTMFLDELTEMSMPLQAKLLRVVQDGVVRRVGSEKVDAVVDVRFISATNRDPQKALSDGRLRSDLLYRLRVVPIRIPPLRERVDDIPLLAAHFLSHFWEQHRRPGSQLPKLTQETMRFLGSRPWRGNVRELQNVIEHLSVLAEPGKEVHPGDISLMDGAATSDAAGEALSSDVLRQDFHTAKERLVTDFERMYLRSLVDRSGGNMSRAARLASIDRTTLYRLMEKHNLGTPREPSMDLEG